MNLTGQLLVSMPSLEDERFFKTVIYMCAHSKEGAMGIIINKKIDYDLYPDLLKQLGIDKPLENFPSGNNEADARLINQRLENLISKDLSQYMWSLRLFQTRPEGKTYPYR